MKTYLFCLLLFGSFTSASPIRIAVPTISASRTSLADYPSKTGEQNYPSNLKSQAYATHPPYQSHASEHYTQESQLNHSQYTPMPFSHSKASHYGSFYGKSISGTRWYTSEAYPSEDDPNSTSRRVLATCIADIVNLIDRNGPEFVILTLFVLVPLAYLVLGMFELVVKRYTREQFPHRGRDQIRLFGPERQLRTWSNIQREKLLNNEKRWWRTQRARS
jgi:hypothetical protein